MYDNKTKSFFFVLLNLISRKLNFNFGTQFFQQMWKCSKVYSVWLHNNLVLTFENEFQKKFVLHFKNTILHIHIQQNI